MFVEKWLNACAGALFGNSSYTPPTTLYLALCSQQPSVTGVISGEPSEQTGYRRYPLPNNTSTFSTPNAGIVTNLSSIKMAEINTDAGTVEWWALCESPTGNAVAFDKLTEARRLVTDSQVSINAGELRIGVENI